MAEATFSEPTAAEVAWVQGLLARAPDFVSAYAPSDAGRAVTLAALDRAWAAWLGQGSEDNDEINGSINVVGITFGQFLVDEAGFR